MTIKELERQTGLPRTTIRFYEQEGLIAPERRENNYRDYSEEDAATLEKIKLLRRLGVTIEALRRESCPCLRPCGSRPPCWRQTGGIWSATPRCAWR